MARNRRILRMPMEWMNEWHVYPPVHLSVRIELFDTYRTDIASDTLSVFPKTCGKKSGFIKIWQA
jgi:hypothetical protein